ncbi:hypothetical protein ACFS6I_10915 [Sphingobacterium anhuiense]|uniref:Uncharacterized protein n=1 Tax=Sphingobacterium anhuiense TaxID=493780 RepID=A0ABW5YVE8_9SPHI
MRLGFGVEEQRDNIFPYPSLFKNKIGFFGETEFDIGQCSHYAISEL